MEFLKNFLGCIESLPSGDPSRRVDQLGPLGVVESLPDGQQLGCLIVLPVQRWDRLRDRLRSGLPFSLGFSACVQPPSGVLSTQSADITRQHGGFFRAFSAGADHS
ncbi:hypothetical protein [Roseimaritima sediminicola]|uniref:hypothetical protein n=1 Tax=Roseimaritima sediminicola TaxID=2662066 RepID=UPI0012983B50|nr:hypothetical protein [Roseimaritima sediminicola]